MPDIYLDVDVALASVPVNIYPLTDDTDFKSQKTSVAYNAAGMALKWNFIDRAGTQTQTAVTPTTSGVYDWTNKGGGMYTIEIPASGGGSINNDTEGFGWFTGICTGILSWRGPTICFRPSRLNKALIDGSEWLSVDAFEQKFTVASGTLQPKKPDGTTNTSYSKTLATDAAAIPIIGST